MTRININLVSYGSACLAYSLLGISMAVFWRNRALSLAVILCVVLTAVWGGVIAFGTLLDYPPIKLIQTAEAARNVAWMFLLYSMYGSRVHGRNHFFANRRWVPWFFAGFVLILLHLFALTWIRKRLNLPETLEYSLNHIMWLGFSIATLVMLEQVFRISTKSERWRIKYLCVGLGFIYVFDFLMYTEALILRQLNPMMWLARGAIVAATAPLIAVSILRSRKHSPETQVSRHVVFHTFTLLAAGIYLVFIACVAYAINVLGGTWGGVLQITFLSVAGLAFVSVVISERVRDYVRVWLSKHFFSYRYDYRREWLDFTQTLAESASSTPRAVTQAMTKICGSPAALLWVRSEGNVFHLIEQWQMEDPGRVGDLAPLARWLERTEWIIDFQELWERPEMYGNLEMPEELEQIPRAWLVVPLMFTDRLQGILLMTRPDVVPHLNWEDRDLLKVAGRAAATHIARYQAHNSLVELRQFEAFNRLSAYVVHDLKNILAQQSLIVSNATRHRNNPEFIDDVFATIENSVQRMTRLMAQMRSGMRGQDKEEVELVPLLERVIASKSQAQPAPRLLPARNEVLVEADGDQLATVFGHLIQNAQDATPPSGRVTVRVRTLDGRVEVAIQDTGVGMDEQFIRHRLFKPFDSTKGLTGMGIGAVESREYVRSLGGEMLVHSTPGVGSCFSVVLPCAPHVQITKPNTGNAVVG